MNAKLLFERNTDQYIEIMTSAEAANVDIIVFPESSLNMPETSVFVPPENEHIDLCTSNDTYDRNLIKIACAARDVKKYVVVNLYMKVCSEHDRNKHKLIIIHRFVYNANVVFDRAGKVISM